MKTEFTFYPENPCEALRFIVSEELENHVTLDVLMQEDSVFKTETQFFFSKKDLVAFSEMLSESLKHLGENYVPSCEKNFVLEMKDNEAERLHLSIVANDVELDFELIADEPTVDFSGRNADGRNFFTSSTVYLTEKDISDLVKLVKSLILQLK